MHFSRNTQLSAEARIMLPFHTAHTVELESKYHRNRNRIKQFIYILTTGKALQKYRMFHHRRLAFTCRSGKRHEVNVTGEQGDRHTLSVDSTSVNNNSYITHSKRDIVIQFEKTRNICSRTSWWCFMQSSVRPPMTTAKLALATRDFCKPNTEEDRNTWHVGMLFAHYDCPLASSHKLKKTWPLCFGPE